MIQWLDTPREMMEGGGPAIGGVFAIFFIPIWVAVLYVANRLKARFDRRFNTPSSPGQPESSGQD